MLTKPLTQLTLHANTPERCVIMLEDVGSIDISEDREKQAKAKAKATNHQSSRVVTKVKGFFSDTFGVA